MPSACHVFRLNPSVFLRSVVTLTSQFSDHSESWLDKLKSSRKIYSQQNISVSLDYIENLLDNMQSTVFTILFVKVCLTLHGITAVLAELPSPSNIRINSVNMGLVLEWDAPQNHTENITYRAEYR
ncbi:unnamed protein product [Oncorhynchus mykiss]|uniref:Fibronectin type-III domain-containing protein n=1 Tax=Oncorhynchus mykiss TaxID=8022 RepID=A0A060XYX9_ONCMY|nr:unnamed protein product [Oncorhynchus mykiss]